MSRTIGIFQHVTEPFFPVLNDCLKETILMDFFHRVFFTLVDRINDCNCLSPRQIGSYDHHTSAFQLCFMHPQNRMRIAMFSVHNVENFPYGLLFQKRPDTAAVLYPLKRYKWKDARWMTARKKADVLKKPMNIYEVKRGAVEARQREIITREMRRHPVQNHTNAVLVAGIYEILKFIGGCGIFETHEFRIGRAGQWRDTHCRGIYLMGRRDKGLRDFLSAVIKDIRPPLAVFAAAGILMLIKRGAVEARQREIITREMRRTVCG